MRHLPIEVMDNIIFKCISFLFPPIISKYKLNRNKGGQAQGRVAIKLRFG